MSVEKNVFTRSNVVFFVLTRDCRGSARVLEAIDRGSMSICRSEFRTLPFSITYWITRFISFVIVKIYNFTRQNVSIFIDLMSSKYILC